MMWAEKRRPSGIFWLAMIRSTAQRQAAVPPRETPSTDTLAGSTRGWVASSRRAAKASATSAG